MRARIRDGVMRGLAAGKLGRSEAAERLGGISVRHVNRLMKEAGVVRPRSSHAQARADARLTAKLRRESKERAARAVVGGQYDPLYASRAAGCSVRTMYRWVAKLKKPKVSARKRAKSKKKKKK